MRRADAIAALAVLALAGCMRIYPDAELPDLVVTWFSSECRNAETMKLSLAGLDDTTFQAEMTVSCGDEKATFVDVPRQRIQLRAALVQSDGEEIADYEEPVDLRNGLDQRSYLYFGPIDNLFVTWTFEMGASCESLAADVVEIELSNPTIPELMPFTTACEAGSVSVIVPHGVYGVLARALSEDAIVALSLAVPPVEVTFDSFTQVDLVLSPCDASCP